eukprot:10242725-Heterocapsa_arctica.AAC.1
MPLRGRCAARSSTQCRCAARFSTHWASYWGFGVGGTLSLLLEVFGLSAVFDSYGVFGLDGLVGLLWSILVCLRLSLVRSPLAFSLLLFATAEGGRVHPSWGINEAVFSDA